MEDFCQEPRTISVSYGCAVANLLNDIEMTKPSLKIIRRLFQSFSKKYTMLPYLWKKWLGFEENSFDPDYDIYEANFWKRNINMQARKHFLHEHFYDKAVYMNYYIGGHCILDGGIFVEAQNCSLMYPTTVKSLEKLLCFPHVELDKNFTVCQQNSTRPVPFEILKKYEHSAKLFNDNYIDEINITKNFENLGDKEYIIRSFEHFVGHWPYKKDIWKRYIQYLEKTNTKKLLLTVYSRYCRLFFDDHSLADEYLEKIKESNNLMENVSQWWIDLIEFERIFISYQKARASLDDAKILNKFKDYTFLTYVEWFSNNDYNNTTTMFDISLPSVEDLELFPKNYFYCNQYKTGFQINKTTQCSSYFTNENVVSRQPFVFRSTYIKYILKASNPVILQKLFESCKYFFVKSKRIFCHRLGVFDNYETKYFEQSLFLNSKNINFYGINKEKIVVTNMLQISVQNNPLFTSTLLPKIQCLISHLQLKNQFLTFNEFELIAANKIQTVYFENVTVTKSNSTPLFVEDIIEKFPVAEDIRFSTINSNMYSPKTGENLAKLNRTKNITYFKLYNVPQNLNSEFFTFIQKHVVPVIAGIIIIFAANVQDNFKEEFKKTGQTMLAAKDIYLFVEKL